MSTRRTFLGRALGACSALFAARAVSAQTMQMPMPPAPPQPQAAPPATHGIPLPGNQ